MTFDARRAALRAPLLIACIATAAWAGTPQAVSAASSCGTPPTTDFAAMATILLSTRDYGALDELAARLRRERSWHDPITWDIQLYYEGLAAPSDADEVQQLAKLRAWVAASPPSTAARIALAAELYQAAWRRRGEGFANELTPEQRAGYAERGGDVRGVVRAALARGHHDPSLFRDASGYFHPRWGGSGPLYRSWAEEVATATRSTFGDGMYAWLGYQARANVTQEHQVESYGFDWDRMKRGFEDVIALKPECRRSQHRFAVAASQWGDQATARRLFLRSELEWYDEAERMWGGRGSYDHIRNWALMVTPPPPLVPAPRTETPAATARQGFAEKPFREWPQIVLQAELELPGGKHRLATFFVRSGSRVTAVTAMPRDPMRMDDDNAIRDVWRASESWTVWLPGTQRDDRSRVASILTSDAPNPQLGVAVELAPAPATPLVQVLEPRMEPRDLLRHPKVFVVGCRWAGSRCDQVVVEATVAAGHMSDTYRSFEIGLTENYGDDAFLGAPILDEDGYVIGVASGPSGSHSADYAQLVGADFVESALPR
jgi:hypothetical protein